MKSTSLLICFLVIFSNLNAQDGIVIKAGANFSGFDDLGYIFSSYERKLYKFSPYVGVNTNFKINNKSRIKLELLYAEKGSNGGEEAIYGEKLKLHYLNLPLLIDLNLSKKLHLHFGPEFGWLLSAQSVYPSQSDDVSSNFKDVDLGAALGFSYDIGKRLMIETRWIEGALKLQEGLYGNLKELGPRGRNRAIQFGLGYRII